MGLYKAAVIGREGLQSRLESLCSWARLRPSCFPLTSVGQEDFFTLRRGYFPCAHCTWWLSSTSFVFLCRESFAIQVHRSCWSRELALRSSQTNITAAFHMFHPTFSSQPLHQRAGLQAKVFWEKNSYNGFSSSRQYFPPSNPPSSPGSSCSDGTTCTSVAPRISPEDAGTRHSSTAPSSSAASR